MANRSWFYASDGQQQGPFPEGHFRELIARGTVTPDTLVWSEGMTGWQRAGEIPDLAAGGSGPPVLPQSGAPMASGAVASGQAVSVEFSIWELLGRVLIFTIGFLLVIPAPWVATSFYKWMVEHLRVPQRSQLAFTGKVGDIWYVFIILALCTYAGASDVSYLLPLFVLVLQAFLSWMTVRWVVANISADGREPSFSFAGSPLGYVGWYLLLFISAITIIGWAWVTTAWMRWMCRHVTGTRRAIIFNGSGLQVLWRTVVFALASSLIIPIPWVLAWYARWFVSQFELVRRSA